MARRRASVPRNWRRGFDWDSATFAPQILLSGQTFYDWVRIPSDNFDPLVPDPTDRVPPKTLVKTLVYPHISVAPLTGGDSFQAWLGLIAWDGADGNAPVAADVPDVTNGAYDWLLWLPMAGANVIAAGSTIFNNDFQGSSYIGGLYTDAQRKLPPGRGLLAIFAFAGPAGGFCNYSLSVRMGLKGDVTAVGLGGS